MSGYGGTSSFRCIYCGGYTCTCVPDEDDDDMEEGEEMGFCDLAGCVMNYQPHFPSECYTPEMYEAYVAEVESSSDPTSGQQEKS